MRGGLQIPRGIQLKLPRAFELIETALSANYIISILIYRFLGMILY